MRMYFIFLVTFFQVSFAQNERNTIVDSLKSSLSNLKGFTKENIHLYNELAYEYHLFNPEIGIKYSDSALQLSKKLKLDLSIETSYQRKAQNYSALDKLDDAIKYYDSAIAILEKRDYPLRLGKVYANQAIIYRRMSNYAAALERYEAAYSIFKKDENPLQSFALNGIGIVATYMSNYQKAIKAYQDGLLILEKEGKSETIAYGDILNNLGLLYAKFEEQNPVIILDYHERARLLFKELGHKMGEADVLLNQGNVFDENGEHEEALKKYTEAKSIFEDLNSISRVIGANVNIGIVKNNLREYQEARKLLKGGVSYYKEVDDQRNLAIANGALGENYLFTEEYNAGIKSLTLAIQSAKSIYNDRLVYSNQKLLASVYEKLGDSKNAYKYLDSALVSYQAYQNDAEAQKIARLQEEYKFLSQKIKDDATYAREKSVLETKALQRGLFVLIAFLLVITLIILTYLQRRKKEATHQRKIAELQLTKAKSQIRPHFIFNTLTAIDNYVAEGEAEQASEYLKEFASIMRQGLDNSENETISLQKEIQFLTNYLDIEKLRKSFTYEIKTSKNIDQKHIKIPALILQPIIENSIEHARPKKNENLHITISFTLTNNDLVSKVIDNGIGRWERKEKITNVGLPTFGIRLTKERLAALNSLRTKREHKISYSVSKEKSETTLIFPLKNVS